MGERISNPPVIPSTDHRAQCTGKIHKSGHWPMTPTVRPTQGLATKPPDIIIKPVFADFGRLLDRMSASRQGSSSFSRVISPGAAIARPGPGRVTDR